MRLKLFMLATAGVMCLALAVGCKKSQLSLQEVKAQNLQIQEFKISTEANAEISSYVFSIRNLESSGQISNIRPLPYRTDLLRTKLSIQVPTDVKVSVAIKPNEWLDWTSSTVFGIPNDIRKFTIRISAPDGSAQYSYVVDLKQYQFDPQTIEWSAFGAFPQNLLGRTYGKVIEHDGGTTLMLNDGAGATKAYVVASDGTALERPLSSEARPGEIIEHIEQTDKQVYAHTNMNRLYRLVGNNWQEVATGGVKVVRLLGILKSSVGQSYKLALLVEEAGKIKFATYQDNSLTTHRGVVPQDFPAVASREDIHTAYAEVVEIIGPRLVMHAVTRTSDPNKNIRSTWYTTNGEDWMRVYTNEIADASVHSASFVKMNNTLYRFESTSKGLDVYTSSDQGKSWQKNGDQATLGLSVASLAQRNIFAWREASSNTIRLLVGVDIPGANTAQIWRGVPKSNEY